MAVGIERFAERIDPTDARFDEGDLSDKPAFIRSIPPLGDEQIGRLEDEYRRSLASLQAIDDMVESIVNELEAAQVLERTYVIYSSDSGAVLNAAARSPQIYIALPFA